MRRRTQKSLTHLLILLFILGLILFLNRPQSPHRLFAWDRVRYRTRAKALPPANGVCPGLADSARPALVVSHVESDGDTGWMGELEKKYHLCVYHIETSSTPSPASTDGSRDDADTHNPTLRESSGKTLHVPTNRAHEAITYLTFLIDNYAALPPQGAVFVHGSRFAWHNDDPVYDNLSLLRRLNLPFALHAHGYHNLRCDWSLSTCSPGAGPQGSLENSVQAVLQPWSARTVSDRGLPGALEEIFGQQTGTGTRTGKGRLGRTDTVRSQCCAQFAVSRESMWQHSREEYIALRQWLLDGMDGRRGAAPKDDRVAGRIISYIWHILFLRRDAAGGVDLDELNRKACPSAEECYCRLYGRCGLRCTTPGSCWGQYALPKHLRLPEDWAEGHS